MEEVKVFSGDDNNENVPVTPRAGFLCGYWCYSGFLCPGGSGCN